MVANFLTSGRSNELEVFNFSDIERIISELDLFLP